MIYSFRILVAASTCIAMLAGSGAIAASIDKGPLQVRDNRSVNMAFRHALTNGHPVNEVRAGLTFGFPLRSLDEHSTH
jgi:hypothetical protein